MKVRLGTLKELIRECLHESTWAERRKRQRSMGEIEEADGGWFDNVLSKAKEVAMTDIGGPEGFLSPADRVSRNVRPKKGPSSDFLKWQEQQKKKKSVSETGSYYGKTASAKGSIMGGNGQKPEGMTCSCGDPECHGCENAAENDWRGEQNSDWEYIELDEPAPMCWCGDRDCSHYE